MLLLENKEYDPAKKLQDNFFYTELKATIWSKKKQPKLTLVTFYDQLLQLFYYHLHSTVMRERFFAHVYFSNETVSQTTVSTGPMKMFRLEHETMNVCKRNMTRFAHVECTFDKINDIFQDFGSLVSLRLQKDRCAKSKQIWTKLSHWNTEGPAKLSLCRFLTFFNLFVNVELVK